MQFVRNINLQLASASLVLVFVACNSDVPTRNATAPGNNILSNAGSMSGGPSFSNVQNAQVGAGQTITYQFTVTPSQGAFINGLTFAQSPTVLSASTPSVSGNTGSFTISAPAGIQAQTVGGYLVAKDSSGKSNSASPFSIMVGDTPSLNAGSTGILINNPNIIARAGQSGNVTFITGANVNGVIIASSNASVISSRAIAATPGAQQSIPFTVPQTLTAAQTMTVTLTPVDANQNRSTPATASIQMLAADTTFQQLLPLGVNAITGLLKNVFGPGSSAGGGSAGVGASGSQIKWIPAQINSPDAFTNPSSNSSYTMGTQPITSPSSTSSSPVVSSAPPPASPDVTNSGFSGSTAQIDWSGGSSSSGSNSSSNSTTIDWSTGIPSGWSPSSSTSSTINWDTSSSIPTTFGTDPNATYTFGNTPLF